jgi:hypothetical protein
VPPGRPAEKPLSNSLFASQFKPWWIATAAAFLPPQDILEQRKRKLRLLRPWPAKAGKGWNLRLQQKGAETLRGAF